MRRPLHFSRLAMIGAALLLAAASLFWIGEVGGAFHSSSVSPSGSCSAPSALSGTVVRVTLTNMEGQMMGGGMMRIFLDRTAVPAGEVSFVVANTGTMVHEMVVLPLAPGQQIGERTIGNDNRVSELDSLGEASNNCGAGAGEGIEPGGISWTTMTLKPGNYELICNIPGHYAAGMYAELTVN